jgi:hypothetical protein
MLRETQDQFTEAFAAADAQVSTQDRIAKAARGSRRLGSGGQPMSMINLSALSSPRMLKEAAREASYPNSQVEAEVIAAADAAANAVVARHRNLMEADAVERLENGEALLRVSTDLENALSYDVRVKLQRGGNPTELAKTYTAVESDINKMIATLRHEAAKASLLADRLEDPESDYERLIERLPALRRGIL